MPGLSLTVHAATEWNNSDSALARCTADIAAADIVVATMLFMEDHFHAGAACTEALGATTAMRWSVPCRPAR